MTELSSFNLAIVLPICKPKVGWPAVLISNIQDVQKTLPGVAIQFIVVNDGYETPQLLSLFEILNETYPFIHFISYPINMGKGYALRTGVKYASTKYIITTDFDFPYENDNLATTYEKLLKGSDIVAGRRMQEYFTSIPFKRKVISKSCIWLNKTLLKLPDGDTQSGLKGFNQKGRRLFLFTRINRFLVDTEFLHLAYKRNYAVSTIDLKLKPEIRFSAMGIKILFTETKNLFSIFRQNKVQNNSVKKTFHVQPKNIPDFRFGRI
jgi:dolichyl-phosphate beta-glucosyltransferase